MRSRKRASARKRSPRIIDQALADTQEFIANARASLIAEQLAGRLRELIRQLASRQFRQDYDNVVKVRGGRADALDPEETNAAAKLSDVARNAPLEQWIKEMIGAWASDHPPAARANVAVLRTANSHAFEVDEAALRPDGLSIVSTWATQDFSVSAAPLLPLTEDSGGARRASVAARCSDRKYREGDACSSDRAPQSCSESRCRSPATTAAGTGARWPSWSTGAWRASRSRY